MEEVEFEAVLAHIAERCLSKEDIENLQEKEVLSEEQMLRLIDELLSDIKINGYDSALVTKNLDISVICEHAIQRNNTQERKPYTEKTLKILETLSEANFPKYRSHLTVSQVLFFFINVIFAAIPVLIMLGMGSRFDKKIADVYPFGSLPAVLEDVSSQFNKTVKNSVVEAHLIGDSVERNINASIQEYRLSNLIDIIKTMKSLKEELSNPGIIAWFKNVKLDDEKINFLQKVIDQLKACGTSPSISEIMSVKKQFEDHLNSLILGKMPDYEKKLKKVLNYLERLEALALYKNGINYTYSGIQQKHQLLLQSDLLGEEEKKFIEQLSNDLAEYVTYPLGIKLEIIKEKINAELNKKNLSEIYKNDLKGVLYWFELQQLRFKERFKKFANTYPKLQQHGKLMLPLNQGLDLYIGKGMCVGYQQAWSARALNGGGEKSIFGVKPDDEEPPFTLIPYDGLDPRGAKLNHLFPVTTEITDLQEIQNFPALFEPKRIKENGTFEYFINWVVKKVNSAPGDQKVFQVSFSVVDDQGASNSWHALALWKTNAGVYHFFDANYGWFRCKDEKKFKLWFNDYLSASILKYGECTRFNQLSLSNCPLNQLKPYANSSATNPAEKSANSTHAQLLDALALEMPELPKQQNTVKKNGAQEVLPPKDESTTDTPSRLVEALALEESDSSRKSTLKDTGEQGSFATVFHQPEAQVRKTAEEPNALVQDHLRISSK